MTALVAIWLALPGSAFAGPTFSSVATIQASGSTTAAGVALLPDGSSVVVGRFYGTVTFGSTILESARTSPPTYYSADAYAAKRNPDGSWAWAKQLLSTSSDDEALSITVATDGAIVVAARADVRSGHVFRISSGGTTQWDAPITSDGHDGIASIDVAALDHGAVAVSGVGVGIITFDSATSADRVIEAGAPHGFVARLDGDADFAWVAHMIGGGPSDVFDVNGLAGLADGSSVIGGVFTGTASFGGTPLASYGGNRDGFVVRLAADGDVVGATRVTSRGGPAVAIRDVGVDREGDAVVVGGTGAGTIHFGDDLALATTGSAIVAKQGADGHFAWASASTGVGEFQSVAVRPDGSSVAAGWTASGSRFPAGGTAFIDGPIFALGVGAAIALGVSPAGRFGWAAAGTAVTVTPDYGSGSRVMEAVGASALADGSVRIAGFIDGYEVASAAFGTLSVSPNAGAFTGFIGQLLDVPSAPAAPTGASTGADRITVSVAPNAGPSVTRYEITAAPGGATCTIVPPATSCTVTGLRVGAAYRFTAVAVNAEGSSTASTASEPVTPAPVAADAATSAATWRAVQKVRSIPVTLAVSPNGWVRATFRTVPGATRYRISASPRGRAYRARTARCTAGERTVRCALKLTPGRWSVTVTASAKLVVIARATRSVTVKTPRRPIPEAVTG